MLKIKPLIRPLVLVAVVLAAIGFILKFQDIHRNWLRNKVAARVFEIRGTPNSGGGTGFQVEASSGTAYIVTNSHVCEGAIEASKDKNFLLVRQNKHWMKRRILEISGEADLCLIEGWPNLSGLSLGADSHVSDLVSAIGHPELGPLTMSSGEVTGFEKVVALDHLMPTGNAKLDKFLHVSKRPCDQPKNEIIKQEMFLLGVIPLGTVPMCLAVETDAIRTNISIFPGNSGSPLVDGYGNVVGVIFAADTQTNWGFAVNLKHLKYFLSDY